MRILFMGTPDFSDRILYTLLSSKHEVVGVVTGKDKPKDRGHALTETPVKKRARENGILALTPDTLKSETFLEEMRLLEADIAVVAAYGKILPPSVLEEPRFGCINVHASLLPKYRGADPIRRCLLDGEETTGVTIMQMAEGLDTGDILLQEEIRILPDDNYETLHDRLAFLGGELLLEALDRISKGKITRTVQDDAQSSYAEKTRKEDAILDFSESAQALERRIRAFAPSPLARTETADGKILKILSAKAENRNVAKKPGEVALEGKNNILIQTGDGCLRLLSALPEGKGKMTPADLINGRRIRPGDVLGSH